MALFGNNKMPEEKAKRVMSLAYFAVDRLWYAVNYHRMLCTVATVNMSMIIVPGQFPGKEQFQVKVQMLEELRQQFRDSIQWAVVPVFNFDLQLNMKRYEEVLDEVTSTIKQTIEYLGDALQAGFDPDRIPPDIRHQLYLVYGECLGESYALDAEIEELQCEYAMLRKSIEGDVPKERLDDLDHRYINTMQLRVK